MAGFFLGVTQRGKEEAQSDTERKEYCHRLTDLKIMKDYERAGFFFTMKY